MISHPPQGRACCELGSALRREGRLAEAFEVLQRAVERSPEDAGTWNELAHTLRRLERHEEAQEAARRAIELNPRLAVAWFNLGAAQAAQGRWKEAVEAYRRALELDPQFAEVWSNLGEALGVLGDRSGEIEAYRRAVSVRPALAPAWSNLGGALLEAGRLDEAIAACRRAVELDADFPLAWSNLGNALRERGKFAEAVKACERALELSPASGQSWSNLGSALLEADRFEEALAAHGRALEIAPDDARAHYNLGIAWERCRRQEIAVESYRRAVALDPEFVAAAMRLACALLMLGRFEEGWPAYEWRWKEKNAPERRFDFAPWAGELDPGRRLLAWGEQGIGDEILYSSMIGELLEAGLRVTLETDPRLVPLLHRSFPGLEVVARSDPPSLDPAAFEAQCPLASLGRWLRPSFERFRRHGGYLRPDPARTAAFSARLRAGGGEKVVGISWRSANREFGADKSSRLADWAAVLAVPGVRFVNLQYGDSAAERELLRQRHGLEIEHVGELDLFADAEGLAALCAACDLVITVSNVNAHMAGALGRPVWLLVPAAKGRLWYWFVNRTDSPWYPSMRLFEQERPGDWRPVLDTVARELASFVASSD